MSLMLKATDEQVIRESRKCLKTQRDAIFVCGGGKALCYFPKPNLWYKLSNMPFQHDDDQTPSQCRGKVYIPCNDTDTLGKSRLMEYYIPSSNSWGAVQTETRFTSTAILKGYLYAAWMNGAVIYRYNPEKNCHHRLKAQPTSRYYTCVLTDENYLYVIGGYKPSGWGRHREVCSTTERFDPSVNEWEEVAPINEARYDAFGTSMNGNVYIAGGRQHNGRVISTSEVYNPQTNEWQLMASLREPRTSGSMVSHEGRLYVLGGHDFFVRGNAKLRRLSVEVFHSEENKWKEKSTIPVKSFETQEEEEKKIPFKACFARIYREMIDRLKPLKV